MKKRILAVLLSVLMLLPVLSVSAVAADRTLLVVLGDSIAYGSGLTNPREAVYGRIVADTNSWAYENYAIPGSTTQALLRRLENEQVKDAVTRADVISISIGGNNFLLDNLGGLLFNGIVKNDYTRIDEIAADFETDLRAVVGAIRAANADAVIVLQTIYNPQTSYVGMVYQQGADRINAKITACAEENENILVAPVAGALTEHPGDFAQDRIHPSAQGNEKIAVVLLDTLAGAGLCDAAEPVVNTPGKDVKGTGSFGGFVNVLGFFLNLLAKLRSALLRG